MSIQIFCRICTNTSKELMSIFKYYKFSNSYLEISKVITYCASIQINKLDGYSHEICKKCLDHLCQAYSFKRLCLESDKKYRRTGNLKMERNKVETKISYDKDNNGSEGLNALTEIKSEAPDVEFYEIKSEFNEEETKINYGCLEKQSTTVETDHGYSNNMCVKYQWNQRKLIKCIICNKPFKSRSALEYHEETHSNDRPHACYICGHSFEEKLQLQVHTRIHTGEKPYKCNICYEQFKSTSDLYEHKAIHVCSRYI